MALLLALILAWIAGPICSYAHTPQDEVLESVGVDEKQGNGVPLDLMFTNQDGRRVTLGSFFTGGPVILSLNYYSCPTLCPLVFNNLVRTMVKVQGLSLKKDFLIVTVSIDPQETVARAKEKSAETYSMIGSKADYGQRWPFLLGGNREVRVLAGSVGFRYLKLGQNNFAHPSVLVILTPDGRVSRYLYGLEHDPRDLKLALIEAAGGKIGGSTILNRVLLYCYHYDPAGKKYALAAANIMKIAGGLVLGLLALLFIALRRQEKSRGDENPVDGN